MAKLLRREGLGLRCCAAGRLLVEIAESLGFRDLETLYVGIGDGNTQANTVVSRLVRLVRPEEKSEDDEPHTPPQPVRRVPDGGIAVEGMDDMLVRVSLCCSPLPGDPIVGYVTVGRGVSIHRADCTNVGALADQSERMIEVGWSPEHAGTFRAAVQAEALDRPRLLRDVTSALSDLGANIVASSTVTNRDRVAILRFEIELSDVATLDRAIEEIRGVDGCTTPIGCFPGGRSAPGTSAAAQKLVERGSCGVGGVVDPFEGCGGVVAVFDEGEHSGDEIARDSNSPRRSTLRVRIEKNASTWLSHEAWTGV